MMGRLARRLWDALRQRWHRAQPHGVALPPAPTPAWHPSVGPAGAAALAIAATSRRQRPPPRPPAGLAAASAGAVRSAQQRLAAALRRSALAVSLPARSPGRAARVLAGALAVRRRAPAAPAPRIMGPSAGDRGAGARQVALRRGKLQAAQPEGEEGR